MIVSFIEVAGRVLIYIDLFSFSINVYLSSIFTTLYSSSMIVIPENAYICS